MMTQTLKGFLRYAEIRTKVTSVFPFILTLAYLHANGRRVSPLPSLVFFLGMFLFDLTATTINNYADSKKNGQQLPFSGSAALAVTITLLALSVMLGLYLVTLTDMVILLAGGLCFLFGITYSWGPVPISHGPYGEVTSGFFYGLLIPFILMYSNDPTYLMSYSLSAQKISVELNVMPVLGLLLLAVLPFCLTANIMLANNICDLQRDIAVQRYTLAYYLKVHALHLFALLYYAAYLSVAVMVAFRLLPPLSLLTLLTLIPVQKNIHRFFSKQDKEETFPLSVQNFILVISAHIIFIFLGGSLPGWA